MDSQTQQQRRFQGSRELSSDDLAMIVKEASRRQDDAKNRETDPSGVKTIEDAYALAKELGIPEEYVTEAASKVALQKAVTGGIVVRGRRLSHFVAAALVSVVGIGAALALGVSGIGFLLIAAVLGTVTLATLLRWLSATTGSPVKQAGVPPVPGTCRVCFRPAHTPQSTFCEEHRYKGPAGR